MTDEKIIKILENLDKRLQFIENLLIKKENEESEENEEIKTKSPKTSSHKENSYEGISGGISLLIDNNFFSKPRSMREVYDELKREGYFYSLQSADTVLRKVFVMRRKALTRIMADKVWKYAIRK